MPNQENDLLKRILVVDDEKDVTELLDYKFRQAGYSVRALNDSLRAIGLARDFRPDLILLDLMMPELTGIQLLRMIRSDALLQDTPVILLTAKGETVDKVRGLETGADDYVTKPFDARELLLRVQSLLRRTKSAAAKPSTRLVAGDLLLDIERHQVTSCGKEVDLTATEFKLLRLMLERKGRVQTREELLADVWNYSPDLETRTVDTHVRRLREKLGASGEVIETIRGVGYRVAG
ncbi:MAG: DNA-binding response regulator [Verrucomicrobia bacterium]|nr:DNA-binding response regulator [Verrucomicrobiota bacterium]